MSNDEHCANCGSVLPTDEWCPVVTCEEEGSMVIHSFCDDDCKEAWVEEHEVDA